MKRSYFKLYNQHSLDETHFFVVMGLMHQEVSPKCVNEEISTERRSYNSQVNRYPLTVMSRPESILIRQD